MTAFSSPRLHLSAVPASSSSASSALFCLLLLSLVALCLCPASVLSQSSSPSPYCGTSQYDLTALSVIVPPTPATLDQDLLLGDGVNLYGLHPCGVVDEAFCGNSGAARAMMCRYGTTLARYDAQSVNWTELTGGQQGVVLSVQNGDLCSASNSSIAVSIQFLCDAGVQEGQLTAVQASASRCEYSAVVRSRYACMTVTAGGDGGLSSGGVAAVSVVAVLVLLSLLVCLALWLRWRRTGKRVTSDESLLDEGADWSKMLQVELQSGAVHPTTALSS